MTKTLYFDDPEDGVARATSHPAFVRAAPQDFYYDCGDDFSPFGNDDGHDTLSGLQDWYRDAHRPASAKVMPYLEQLLADWDFPIPADMLTQSDDAKAAWLDASEMNGTWLASVCRARVATAFGQLKIAGHIDADVHAQALLALSVQQWLNGQSRIRHPQWTHADEDAQSLQTMHAALSNHAAV